jgi:hypothetical protein
MAVTHKKQTVVGNPARRKSQGVKKGHHSHRSNPGPIIGFSLNPAKRSVMATKKRKSNKKAGHAVSKYIKRNPVGHAHHKKSKYTKRNPVGLTTSVTDLVTNAVFVILGALGSKLGAQAILGTNNTGVMGYAGNAAIGAVLWFVTEKLMKNKAASAGVISGTLVQILLRVINDYTPFGSYVAQLGMGDYQMQSFVTPQVLVDPMNSARIRVPAGWGGGSPNGAPRMLAAPQGGPMPAGVPMPTARGNAAAAAGSPAAATGVSGLYNTSGWGGGGLYNAA